MKAIGIKMVDLQPMTAKEAFDKGYGMKPNMMNLENVLLNLLTLLVAMKYLKLYRKMSKMI